MFFGTFFEKNTNTRNGNNHKQCTYPIKPEWYQLKLNDSIAYIVLIMDYFNAIINVNNNNIEIKKMKILMTIMIAIIIK